MTVEVEVVYASALFTDLSELSSGLYSFLYLMGFILFILDIFAGSFPASLL